MITISDPKIGWISISGLAAVAGAILSWIYQTGSYRLGAVDLFGCEISAICRICIVVEFANFSVSKAKSLQSGDVKEPDDYSEKANQFTSEENYTPVYDGKLSDLQPLDAEVTTFVTEFYMYRKTMMDCLRKIAILRLSDGAYGENFVQMIYMQFLMYESGHKAIERLVEFEPNRTESLINIFCSELIVYRFLLDEYARPMPKGGRDHKYERLHLRESEYKEKVPKLYWRTMEYIGSPNKYWQRATTSAAELRKRFEQVFPDGKSLMETRSQP